MEKKVIKKILAVLMVITILTTDFFVLGSSLITYAAQINTETNNSNIEFSAYFKDGEDRVDSIEKSIKSEDLKLYAEIKVKNEGYFNGIIEIQDSNFNVKNEILSSAIASIEGNKVNLKQINAGETFEIELGIEPKISEKISVDMLAANSTIKLTGTYMETTYEGLSIEAEKSVNVNYQIDENANAELVTDIITNRVFSINGTSKRIVQLSVKSRLEENQYPVKQTTLNVNVPQLSETLPEEVNVMAIGKLATNGETEISPENWKYENGIVQIILKNEADSNNEISWNKNIYDELVVTFIYDENVDASKIEIKTDSEIKVHNSNNTYTATFTKGIENQEPNNIITGKTEITTEEIYKGQLYANVNSTEKQDIVYNTTSTLIITNPDVVEEVVAKEGPDIFGTEIGELAANTKYISTEINKEKMLEIFGQDGNIEIKNGVNTILINKDSGVNENGNIVINYESSDSDLSITTSNPVNAGILEIKHTKAITENNYTKTQLREVKMLLTNISIEGNITVEKEKQIITEGSTEASIELKETISKAELTLNKENLSTTEENNVILGVKLITDGVQYDLYKNPTITIQLPQAVEEVKLNETPSKLYADEFEVSSRYNESNKTIEIRLTGEQTKYPESSATQMYLQLNLNMTLSKLATTKTDKITMTYTNENACRYDSVSTDYGVIEKTIGISAPTGLIKLFNIDSNSDKSLTETIIQQATNADIGKNVVLETVLVNNTGMDLNNIRILGKLPTKGNFITNQSKENELETILTSIDAPNAEVYYTQNINATSDITDTTNGWTTSLLDNAKLYLIKLNNLDEADVYTANVNVEIPSTLEQNQTSYAQYEVIYDSGIETDIQELSRTIGLTTSIVAGLESELTAVVGQENLENGDIVKEGEVIKYTAIVKNQGTTTLENMQFKAQVPEGTVLVEPKENYVYEDGYYDEKDATEVSNTINLAPGESYSMQYEVRVKTDITTGSEISNKATIIYNEAEMYSNEIKNVLEESDIRVTLKRTNDTSIQLLPGYTANFRIYVENLSDETIKDLKIQIDSDEFNIKDSEGNLLGSDNKYRIYDESKNEIEISEIPANETYTVALYGVINEDAEKIYISANVDSEGNIYRSNAYMEELPYIDASVTLTSPQNSQNITTGDIVEYNIVVENTGDIDGYISIIDIIPECLQIQEVYINEELKEQITDQTDETTYRENISNYTANYIDLKPGETAQVKIVTKVTDILGVNESKIITNTAEVEFNGIKKSEAEVSHTLIGEIVQEEIKNTISGSIWLDENENQQKDNNEIGLQGIKVRLYNNQTRNYLTDKSGNIIQAVTDEDGLYEFTEIKDGSYKIAIEYDTQKYEFVENSNASSQDLLLNGEMTTIVVTDTIDLQENVENINIGLKQKENVPSVEDPETPTTPEEPENPTTPENPTNPEQPEESVNPENPEDSEEPETPVEVTKSISGTAWLDIDRDGEKDLGEKSLSGIKVRIFNISSSNYLKDEEGNIVETTTNNNGEYIFENIEMGAYIILFEYDKEEYEPTTYLAKDVETTKNSKVILKNINIDGQELILAVTDIINVQDNVENINIGLKEKLIFDLELNKYISKIVVQNSKETKTYDYENKTFGKVEIHRKQINGSLVVLEYTIKVKNNGEISGYAKNIVDYIPNGLTFSSELNKDWYISGNYLYTKGLENTEIKPGEEKEIKLILTKTMTNENTGLINNRAEIYQDYNQFGDIDTDSKPNNQIQGEDDMGAADVIIGTATGGSTFANILLLIINLVLIGMAINLMIRNKIIKLPNKKERR